jgi:biofilm PGA synthesis protein PgaA
MASAGDAVALELSQATATAPGSDDRERAILLAREGRYGEALEILRPLHEADPDDLPLRADLVAALSWAGEDAEALQLGEHLPFHSLEPFISEAVARSARNQGDPTFASRLYLDVLSRDPTRLESHVGAVLTLTERSAYPEARVRLQEAVEHFPESPDLQMAGGHLYHALEHHSRAARHYRMAEILGADPVEARRLEVLSLLDAGAAFLAVERMAPNPKYLHPGERGRALSERGSRAVQWSIAAPPTPHPDDRFIAVDRALAILDSALVAVDPGEGYPWERLRFDRVVALRERIQMEAVLAEVEELEAELELELPPYVLRMVGDAHLHLRNAEEAEVRYRAALEGWPGHPELLIGLFYALVQGERHDEAGEVIRELLDDQPEVRTAEGLTESLPNPDRLSGEIARHLGMAFAGDLKGAEAGLDALVGRAPMNLSLRQELASVFLWRGWPRLALDEYARILALDPHHVGARIGRASAHLNLHERDRAYAALDTLLILAPEHEQVRRDVERYRIDGLWELDVGAHRARSTGGVFGARDDLVEGRFFSPPIGDHHRLFAGWTRSRASYPDLAGRHDRVAVGLERRGRTLHWYGEATADRDGLERPGGGGRIELRPGDHWTLHLDGASHTTTVPLQAARLGIDGWRVGSGVGYRWSERRWWSAEGGLLEMSDGNRRISLYSGLEQEVIRRPHARVSGVLELYGADNSLEGAPYYNPSRTLSTTLTGRWEWMLWRAYERSVTQRILLTGGYLHQEGFDDTMIYSAEYAQEWAISRRFTLDAGVQWARPVYDETRERRTLFHASLNWRLPR